MNPATEAITTIRRSRKPTYSTTKHITTTPRLLDIHHIHHYYTTTTPDHQHIISAQSFFNHGWKSRITAAFS
jgi:hypothetical protein